MDNNLKLNDTIDNLRSIIYDDRVSVTKVKNLIYSITNFINYTKTHDDIYNKLINIKNELIFILYDTNKCGTLKMSKVKKLYNELISKNK